jgi:hypothetical protein
MLSNDSKNYPLDKKRKKRKEKKNWKFIYLITAIILRRKREASQPHNPNVFMGRTTWKNRANPRREQTQ